MDWSQTRRVPNGRATLDSSAQIEVSLTGRPPQNEDDSAEIAARFVRHLNSKGENWSKPQKGVQDEDAVSTDTSLDPPRQLRVQVVRSCIDGTFWGDLGRRQAVTRSQNIVEAANELIAAIRKKAETYPPNQRAMLALVLDASTPNHTFHDVHREFAELYLDECRGFGFESVWIVGAVDPLVTRLDADAALPNPT